MSSIRNIIFAIAVILFVGQVFLYWDYSIDDAFITFNYAESLADGQGLVFNVGDKPVEAYSNALWMFLLAVLYMVGLPTVMMAKILGVVFFVAAGWLWFGHFRRDKSEYGWLAGPLFLVCPLTPFWAVSGLELGLHAFAIAGAIIFLLRRSRWSCLFLALVIWGRPEGFITAWVIIGAAMTADIFQKAFRPAEYLWHILTIILAVAAITIFRVAVFGVPLPNTYYVKTAVVAFNFSAISGMLVGFIPIFALALWSLFTLIRDRAFDRAVVLSLAVFFAQFIVSTLVDPVMNYLFRYLAPFLAAAIFAALYGAAKIGKPAYRAVTLAALIFSLFTPVEKVIQRLGVEREIVSAQNKVIKWADLLPNKKHISLTDIGRIPYYTSQHYIDIFGLASEDIGRKGFNPVIEYLKFPDYFLMVGHIRQDGAIALRFGRERLISQNRGFTSVYRLAEVLSPHGIPPDSVGYHYLILEKNQKAMDSLLRIYPKK